VTADGGWRPTATARTEGRSGSGSRLGLFILGKTLSSLGIWVYTAIALVLAFDVSRSGVGVGVVTAAMFTPQLLVAPVGGRLADGGLAVYAVMIGRGLLAAGCVVVGLAAGLADSSPPYAVLVLASLLVGLGLAISGPAMEALVTAIADRPRLAGVVSVNSVPMVVGRVIGPVLGAAVAVWWSATAAMALAAGLCVAHIAMMRPFLPTRPISRTSWHGAVPAATVLRHLRADRTSTRALAGMFAVGFSTDLSATLAPVVSHARSAAANNVGALVSAYGTGAALGLALFAWLARRARLAHVCRAGLVTIAASMVVMVVWGLYPLDLVCFAVAGLGMMLAYLAYTTHVQRHTPTALRGSVMAVWLVLFVGARPVAAFVDGGVVDAASLEVALVVVALVVAVAALILCPASLRDGREEHRAAA